MRFTRTVTALIAIFTAALLGLTAAPTQAVAPVSGEVAARVKHSIPNLKAGEIRNSGRFYVKGNAVTYPKGKIKLERKRKGAKSWTKVQVKKTSSTGRFKFKFDDRCGTKFRLVLKARGGYEKTKVNIGKIICY
jgi:curli biogenesis system outer membrane secretion channel CsgG